MDLFDNEELFKEESKEKRNNNYFMYSRSNSFNNWNCCSNDVFSKFTMGNYS